jgi:hypothetical protein
MRRIVAFVLIALLIPVGAMAQTPTPEDEGLQTIILNRAEIDRVASAFANYEVVGIQLEGPVLFQFVISTFDDVETAELALDVLAHEYIAEAVASLPDDVRATAEVNEASPPEVGVDPYAVIMTIQQGVWPVNYAVVYVRYDRYVIGAAATGIMGNMIEATVPYIESMIQRIGEVDTSTEAGLTEAGLTEALPALQDMPPGFIVSED